MTQGNSFLRKLFCLLSLAVISPITNGHTQEVLGIGVPYLPNKLSLTKIEDPISEAVLTNISSHFGEGSEKTSLISERRRETSGGQEWIFDYKIGVSLNDTTTYEPQIIIDSINYFKSLKDYPYKEILDNIKSISPLNFPDQNTLSISLKQADPDFPKKISKIPLVNTSLAELFKDRIGEGTNMPTFGHYLIKEFRPNEQIILVKNHQFDLDGNPQGYELIQFKLFKEQGERIRALRTGNILVILIPTAEELSDASTDTTLEIIDSPLKSPMLEESNSLNYDPTKIILRKSLQIDNNFKNTFSLEGIKRGDS